MRDLHTATKTSPCMPQLQKAHMQQWRPRSAKNKSVNKQKSTMTMFHHIKDINKDMEMIKKNIRHPRHCTALRITFNLNLTV